VVVTVVHTRPGPLWRPGAVAVVSHPGRPKAGAQVAPPGRGAAGTVTEVTESIDGEVVVHRASTRWPRPGLLPLRTA
jgi:hypothetical protein